MTENAESWAVEQRELSSGAEGEQLDSESSRDLEIINASSPSPGEEKVLILPRKYLESVMNESYNKAPNLPNLKLDLFRPPCYCITEE